MSSSENRVVHGALRYDPAAYQLAAMREQQMLSKGGPASSLVWRCREDPEVLALKNHEGI